MDSKNPWYITRPKIIANIMLFHIQCAITPTYAIWDHDPFRKGRSHEASILMRFIRDGVGCDEGEGDWVGEESGNVVMVELRYNLIFARIFAHNKI